MVNNPSNAGGVGLVRSCDEPSSDWIHQMQAGDGVELLEAWFQGLAYQKHRHDTYAIGVTESGVQAFDYRGAVHVSTPGDVVVLHPDECHDGYAGSGLGFGYRQLYVDPGLIFEAVRALCGRRCSLPFVRQPVVTSAKLAVAIQGAFEDHRHPLAIDELIVQLADGLVDADGTCTRLPVPRHLDAAAIERARQFLAAEKHVVRSWELEAVTGLSRYELARQFRVVVGTSPYRYSLMRRVGLARALIARRRPLVDVALATGFADQAHFTRMFTAAFGITPARYGALSVPDWRKGRAGSGNRIDISW